MYSKLFEYPAPLWRLHSVIATLLVVISVILWAPVVVCLALAGGSRETITWSLRLWNRFVVWVYRLHIDIQGIENHRPDEPSLVVTNHQSLFDIPAAWVALGGNLRMVAKKELFSIPFFGQAIRSSDFIPIDRGNKKSGREASEKIGAQIRSGIHVWVAPEGTRSKDGQLLPFKKGAFAVAISSRVPIQPIVIVNSKDACQKNSLWVRPGTHIRVRVLPRVSTQGIDINDRAKLCEDVRGLVAKELV